MPTNNTYQSNGSSQRDESSQEEYTSPRTDSFEEEYLSNYRDVLLRGAGSTRQINFFGRVEQVQNIEHVDSMIFGQHPFASSSPSASGVAETVFSSASPFPSASGVEWPVDSEGLQPAAAAKESHCAGRMMRRDKAQRIKKVRETFTYCYLHTSGKENAIGKLYEALVVLHWLSADTSPDDFYALFSGELSDTCVVWTGTRKQLYYLVKLLMAHQLISCPHGTGHWEIVQSHVVDKDSKLILNLRGEKDPVRELKVYDILVDLLRLT